MWLFYGLQKWFLLPMLAIYSGGCETHRAGPGEGRFGPHSSPSSRQKHPSQSRQWDASLLAALCLLLLPPPSSPPPPGPAPCEVAARFPLECVTAGFLSPQPQPGSAQLPAEAGAAGR